MFIDLDRANGGVGSGPYWRLVDDTKNLAYDFYCPSKIGGGSCLMSLSRNYERFQNQPVTILAQGKQAWEIEIAGEVINSYEKNRREVTIPDYFDYILFYLGILFLLIGMFIIYRNRKELRDFVFAPVNLA